jgi:hypothetical protein
LFYIFRCNLNLLLSEKQARLTGRAYYSMIKFFGQELLREGVVSR